MASNLQRIARTNVEKETGGVWINYTPTIRFLVARMCERNKEFSKRIEELTRPLNKAALNKQADMSDVVPVSKKAFIETCILDWDGIVTIDDQGNETPLECTKENIVAELTPLPDVVHFLWSESLDISNYRDEDVKN